MKAPVPYIYRLLNRAGDVGHVRIGLCSRIDRQRIRSVIERHASRPRVERDVDLAAMYVAAKRQERRLTKELEGMQVFKIRAFLKPRVVLLNSVSVTLVVQKECEVRIEIKVTKASSFRLSPESH
jgi:hypothetical protein